MPINYQEGKIYKIVSFSTDKIYIGSTTMELAKRLWHHQNDYKQFSLGKKKYISTSKEVLENEDATIYLIEKYPCNNKEELLAREGYYIETLECVNRINPNGKWTKEKAKKYYEDNKEQIAIKKKEYALKNKEKISNYLKKYCEEHKEELSKKKKAYIENNKESILAKKREKIDCECGMKVSRTNLSAHKKTIKHLNYFKIKIY